MPRTAPIIHAMHCECHRCAPRADTRSDLLVAAILLAGGSIAMLIDAAGYTPAIAAALGMTL